MERPVEQLTLREVFTHGERIARELIEHLEQGFLPKVRKLQGLIGPAAGASNETVPDISVRSQAAELLESDAFTQELVARLNKFLGAMGNALERRGNPS